MKVAVLQAADASFNRYAWWSNWVDVAVFDYAGNGYLLQMKVSRRNAKRFHAVQMKGFTGTAHPNTAQVGDLMPAPGQAEGCA